MMILRSPVAATTLVTLLSGLSGCAALNQVVNDVEGAGAQGQVRALPPQVEASPVQLRRSPSLSDLGAYYCPVVTQNAIARLACATVLGPPPPRERMVFEFGITVKVKNPNDIPIPALDFLLAISLFSGQQSEALGATCVSMCGQQDPSCTGAPAAGACTSTQNDIRKLDDFVNRIPGLVGDLISGKAEQELRKSMIVAKGDINLDLAFALGIDQALRVFEKTAGTYVQAMLNRGNAALEVPVSATGTVFVKLPPVGRFGVGFGPLQTVWKVL